MERPAHCLRRTRRIPLASKTVPAPQFLHLGAALDPLRSPLDRQIRGPEWEGRNARAPTVSQQQGNRIHDKT